MISPLLVVHPIVTLSFLCCKLYSEENGESGSTTGNNIYLILFSGTSGIKKYKKVQQQVPVPLWFLQRVHLFFHGDTC